MSFGQPWWLLLLGLGVVIVVLHIRRRRAVEVSSIFIWRHLASSVSPRTNWKAPPPNLLLALQLLALLLLVLALAQPQWGASADALDHRIVLLDASGSMQASDVAPSRFAAARAHVRSELEDLPPRARFSLVTVAADPEVTGARLAGPLPAQSALERARATHGPADWQSASELAAGLVQEGEELAVTVLTDAAGLAVALDDVRAALPGANVQSVVLGSESRNIGFDHVDVTPLDLEAGLWRLDGGLQASGEMTGSVPVRVLFEPAGAEGALEWASDEVELAEDGSGQFGLELELPGPGVLELALPDDVLQHDNHAYFVLQADPRMARVLHVGPENQALQRAIQSIDHVDLFQADGLPVDSADYDLVIVDRVAVPRHPGTHSLWFGVAPPGAEAGEPMADPDPSGWRDDHPLSGSVDWSVLSVAQAVRFERLAGASVLLEAAGAPLVQARTTPNGREVVVAFALEDSNLASQLGFPVFVANLMRWVEPHLGSAVAATCQAGRSCPLPNNVLDGDWHLFDPSGIDLPMPGVADNTETDWMFPTLDTAFRPLRAGLYTLESGETRRFLAVNAMFPQESNLQTMESEPQTGQAQVGESSAWPLWRWLLLAAILVLAVESLIAGRVERFLRRSALVGRNPLAGRHRLVLALQLAALVFLLMALLGVPGVFVSRLQQAVLILDDPGLYGEEAGESFERVVTGLERELGPAQRLGLVRLAGRSHVESDFASRLGAIASGQEMPGANLEGALETAAGMLLPGQGRILLAASGMETRGDAAEVVPRLVASGIPVDVHPVSGLPEGEVLVEEVQVPERLNPGDPFRLQALVYSERSTDANIRILRDGETHTEQSVSLLRGRNRIETTLMEEEEGSYLYELEALAVSDVFAENNRGGVIAQVEGSPRVAIFTPQPGWGDVMADALEVQDVRAEVLTPDAIPWNIEDWLEFDVVVLMNLPAIDLHSQQQEQLEVWVRDHGGGLIILGGENAFGPGGYYQTPLERVSPLSSRVPEEAPEVALLFVLDRSGSMQQMVGEVNRLEIAKEATLAAVDLLNEQSLTGVVVFDSEATVLVPIQSVSNKEEIASSLEPLQPGGGTSLYPALVEAYEQMQEVESTARHVVVMTDGLSQPGDFESIFRQFGEADITVSTVAIGRGADTVRLENLARLGGGAFHATTDFQALPSILAQEALLLSSSPVEEETIDPVWTDRSVSFTKGLPEVLPPLHGYVKTTPKPEADIHWVGPEDIPLLGSWRYGLGRVVAFASHGAGAWSADWLNRPEYPLFWAQAARWVRPVSVRPGLNLTVERRADEFRIVVEALQPNGELHSGLELQAGVTNSNSDGQLIESLRLAETSPGRYVGNVLLARPGVFQVEIEHRAGETDEMRHEAVAKTLYVPYPARYQFSRQDGDLLLGLAHATGGRVLLGGEPLFPERAPLRLVSWTAWPLWTVLGLSLFLFGLVARYAPHALRRVRVPFRRGPRQPTPG